MGQAIRLPGMMLVGMVFANGLAFSILRVTEIILIFVMMNYEKKNMNI